MHLLLNPSYYPRATGVLFIMRVPKHPDPVDVRKPSVGRDFSAHLQWRTALGQGGARALPGVYMLVWSYLLSMSWLLSGLAHRRHQLLPPL